MDSQEHCAKNCKFCRTKSHNTPVTGYFSGNMGEVRAVTDSEYGNSINDSEWVLVDFWAPWCGPCKQMKPHIEELISEGYNIQEIDVDEQPELAKQFNVRGVPTLVVNGNSLVGYRDKSQIKEAVGG